MSGRERAAASGPVGYALALAARAHRQLLQDELAQLGLHLGQELVVVDLAEHPGSTQAALVGRLGVEQPTVAKTITRMERAGLVTRRADMHDRRQIRIQLTAKGIDLVPRVVHAWVNTDRVAGDSLTDGELSTLIRLLGKLTNAATAESRSA